jgi:hypothetical protein
MKTTRASVQRQLDRIKADKENRNFHSDDNDDNDTALVSKTVIEADEEDDVKEDDDERLVIPELLYIPQDGDLPDGHFANASNLVRNRTRYI